MANRPVTGSDSSELSIEESRCLLDKKKVELYELIRQLNSRRNDLASVSVLPPELLGRIFAFVIAERLPDSRCGAVTPSSDVTSPLNFTYVSQNWRNIALDTPALWDTPSFIYPTWARAMMERSKMADLVVNADISLIANLAPMEEVFDNHAARIREVDLHWIKSSFLSSILENVEPFSLHLRSLRLSTSQYDYWTGVDDQEFPVFPAHLLVQPDGLRCLEIERCTFDLYAQPRPLLTHLSMQRPRDRPLLSEFVAAISGMPALETLEMIHSLPLATNAVQSCLKVELSQLSFLHLSSTERIFEVVNVVDFLIVPWTCRINLSCPESISLPKEAEIQLSDIVSPLCLFFSRMTGNADRRSYNRLRLDVPGDGLGLSAWRIKQLHDPTPTDLPDLELSLDLNHQSDIFFGEIIPRLSLFDMQILVLNVSPGPDGIHRLFGQSTTIQTVELQYISVSQFIQALTRKPDGYERLESSYYSVSFPALQTLKFNQTSFQDDTLGEVLDCLMERYERGAPLQKLDICRCYNIGDRDVRLLREIVPNVEWDEIVQSHDF